MDFVGDSVAPHRGSTPEQGMVPVTVRTCARSLPRRGTTAVTAVLAAALLLPGAAAAQGGRAAAPLASAAPPLVPAASPLVPPDDWAWSAARRLDALGLAPAGYDRGASLQTRRDLAWLFEQAAERAPRERPAAAALARAYAARFREEYGDVLGDSACGVIAGGCGAAPTAASPPARRKSASSAAAVEPASAAGVPRRLTLALALGYQRLQGRGGAGVGYLPPDWTGVQPIPDTATGFAAVDGSLVVSRRLSLHAEPIFRAGGVELWQGEALAVLGPIGVWAGRRRLSLGPGEDGGLTLSDHVALDGVGGYLAKPVQLPWLLRALGPMRIEGFLSRVYGGDRIQNPLLIAFRGSFQPHPRLTLGLNRAAMFAGRGNEPITLKNMLFLVKGGVGNTAEGTTGGFANDMLSLDATYRLPTESLLPLLAYLEWGMDDAAGMWHRSPGIIAGVRAGLVPGAPWLSLGAQLTDFVRSTGQNSMWYRNWSLRQGWSDAGLPLGQPLAGEGREWRVTAQADLLDARVRITAAGFTRWRGEQNLLAPQRAGHSNGGLLDLAARLSPAFELSVDGMVEDGANWTTSELRVALSRRL